MINTTKIISIIIFLSVSIMLVSFGGQKAKWKGKIDEDNGIIIVKNPKKPMYGEDVFSLEEELSIGEAEGGEEYMFSQIRGIAVDDEERIYVADRKESHIKVFDKTGKYLRTVGRKGQGPGEIGGPRSVSITSENEIMVPDLFIRRLAFFTLEGEFIKNISTATMNLMTTKIDSKGNIIAIDAVREEENSRYELKKFDSDLNYLYSLGSSPLPDSSRFNPFMAVLRWDLARNDQIVCGYPKTYEIKIFDTDGNIVRKILKDHDPIEITKEDIEETTKGIPARIELSIPKYYSAFQRISVDDENRIYVLTWQRIKNGEGYYFDIFDSEGKYIAKIPLEFQPQAFKKSKLYTIEEDEDGYQYVKRYKVTWRY